MTSLLEYLGTRPAWDAIAAVATSLAVIIALWESARSNRADRERRQAVVVAAMVILNNAAEIVGRLVAGYRRGQPAREVFNASVELGGLRQVLEPAMAIDLTQLPTMEAIDWVLAGRHSIEVADRQIRLLAEEAEPDTELFEAQHIDLIEAVAGLSREAWKFKPWLERWKLGREARAFLKRSQEGHMP
jgi:hypothetical protein